MSFGNVLDDVIAIVTQIIRGSMDYIIGNVRKARPLTTFLLLTKTTNSRADKLIDCALFDKGTKIGTEVV